MIISKYIAMNKVVELGNLTRASEALGCTQSAMSHIISTLEDELGFRLLQRTRSGVTLTPDGELIMPYIRNIINDGERLSQMAASVRGLNAGTVRIATFTSVGVHWLPEMIKSFRVKYPNIDFVLKNGDYYDIERWLAESSADIGFVTAPSSGDLDITPLYEDRILVILPKDHPAARLPVFPLERLRTESVISLPENSSHDVRRALKGTGIRPNVRFYTRDDYAIIAMVEKGLGIAIMPELMVKGFEDRICAMELENHPSRTICMALQPGTDASPAASHFSEHVKAWVCENTSHED